MRGAKDHPIPVLAVVSGRKEERALARFRRAAPASQRSAAGDPLVVARPSLSEFTPSAVSKSRRAPQKIRAAIGQQTVLKMNKCVRIYIHVCVWSSRITMV